MKFDKRTLLLYAVTDRSLSKPDTFLQQLKQSLDGGITMLQLREKNLDNEQFLQEALQVKALCHRYHVPLIINDNVEVALRSNADGIHVGQDDMNASEVRKHIGMNKILGVSAHTVEQALLAQEQGADYLGVGAIFPTDSKKDATAVTLDTLRSICKAVTIPVVAIGGIELHTIKQLRHSGITGVAVIRAIYGQSNIIRATSQLKEAIQKEVIL